jgi:hypothetical protein
MLPESYKSLSEIDDYSDPPDRVSHLGKLLEYLLKEITPNSQFRKFIELLEINQAKFSNYRELDYARQTRNRISHDPKRVTKAQILDAELAFRGAVEEILPYCPLALQKDVRGKPYSKHSEKKAGHQRNGSEQAEQAFARPSDPPEITSRNSGAIWYMLAAVFLLMAVVAYIFRPPHRQLGNRSVDAASQSSNSGFAGRSNLTRAAQATDSSAGLETQSREDEFRSLINSHLSISSTQPNVAFLIDASGPTDEGSIPDMLSGFLAPLVSVQINPNPADINSLKARGFFEDLYAGNSQLLSLVATSSHANYVLVGKAAYSFRHNTTLDHDLVTSDLLLTTRLMNHVGTVIISSSFTSAGVGFTNSEALEHAVKKAAERLKESVFNVI